MDKTLAVIGAGLIGRAWAMVFARAGWRVRLHDRHGTQLDAARAFIASSLDEQARHGLVADPAAAAARIDYVPGLADALAGVDWVQENLPEDRDVKREAFALLDRSHPRGCARELDIGNPGVADSRSRSRAAHVVSSLIR